MTAATQPPLGSSPDEKSPARRDDSYPFDREPVDWMGWSRVGIGVALTLGLLVLGLGYCLVYSALEGRVPPVRVLLWFVPAVLACIGVTWGLGKRPGIGPWGNLLALAIVAGWFGVTFYIGTSMTIARDSHSLILAMYAAATLWMPWLAWIGWTGGNLFSRGTMLVMLIALLVGFHYLVAVPGLTGDRKVQLAMRSKGPGPLVAADASAKLAVALDPTPYDYPQYLGPKRNACFRGVELNLDWKNFPPEKKWRHAVGKGWSAFAIVGDFAFTQEQRGDDESVVCYSLRTGETVWVHSDRDAFRSTFGGDGPRATPTIHEGIVYTVGATGIVNCLAGDTGQVIWSTRIREQNEENLPHGICGSPLLVGNHLYVCPVKSAKTSLMAIDARTGKEIFSAWGGRSAYSSPVMVELDHVPQILCFNADAIVAHDPKTGNVLWKYPWGNDQGVNASQPIVYRDDRENVMVSTSYGKGASLFAVTHDPSGEWSTAQRWKTPKFKNQFSTSVLIDDMAVGLDDGILAAIDLSSGKLIWKGGRYGHGQIIQVGQAIIVLSEQGDLILIDPKGETKELGVVPEAINGKTWNHLAISPPYLLVRNAEEAACYKLAIADDSNSSSPRPDKPESSPANPPTQVKAKPAPPQETQPKVTAASLPTSSEIKSKEEKPAKARPSAFETDLTLPGFDSPPGKSDNVPKNDLPKPGSATEPLPPLRDPKLPGDLPGELPAGLPPVVPPPPSGANP
ncbi:PQQ-binding-like beta-propeller repeat protein [bacterium]|nr:PQQ-binding-like beta-propeller repeat protein [bacterium]